jgi:hypothetical protein
LVGNASRAILNRTEVDLRVVGWFALAASWPHSSADCCSHGTAQTTHQGAGRVLPLTVAWRHLRHATEGCRLPHCPAGAIFSFLSALIGSVGPQMALFFRPTAWGAYIGTRQWRPVMHVTKLAAWRRRSLTLSSVAIGLASAR